MTATTDHYLGIDVHKRQPQVAVLDDEGAVVEEIRVVNADLDEIAEKYAGSQAAIEAGSNYFTIYDRLDEQLDVALTIRPRRIGSKIRNKKMTARMPRIWHDFFGWAKFPKVTFHPKNTGATARLRAVAKKL